jgi:Holliday junction resolvase RusA-like endonuclease
MEHITLEEYKQLQQKGNSKYKAKKKCRRIYMEKCNITKIIIPLRLPSLNNYINECRKNRYAGANMKRQIEEDIMWYINKLPRYKNPIQIHFHWIEENKKRDLDNVCFAKKFILDAMVKAGKLKDDNRNCVTGFTDTFEYAKESKVILEIKEVLWL